MTIWFVSRHPGAREWARNNGIAINRHVDHLDISQINRGDTVIGTLPVNLIADLCEKGATYRHLVLRIPPELRGQELSAEQMNNLQASVHTYAAQRVPEPAAAEKPNVCEEAE